MNKLFNERDLRRFLTLAFWTALLWGLAAYAWYVAYLWIAPIPESSFIVTFIVLPIPFIVYRLASRSRWLANLSNSRFANQIQSLFVLTRRATIILLMVAIVVLVAPRLITGFCVWRFTSNLSDALPHQVAIVFGAGVLPDGRLSPLLKERVETVAELYLTGKVEKILMSGDNRFVDYNEPAAMRDYALSLGVPDSAIVLDYAGRRTYDTCYRASVIFGVKDAVVVTQDYHLARATYTCRTLGIDAIGVATKRSTTYFRLPPMLANVRESLATWGALWELYVSHPIPVLGQPEPIFPPSGK